MVQQRTQMPSPTPNADGQLKFLHKIQRLLESGRFTSTYKFALLIALTNVAVEHGNDSSAPLTVDLTDIAREFLGLYWPQARPYQQLGVQLSQNSNALKPAAAPGVSISNLIGLKPAASCALARVPLGPPAGRSNTVTPPIVNRLRTLAGTANSTVPARDW